MLQVTPQVGINVAGFNHNCSRDIVLQAISKPQTVLQVGCSIHVKLACSVGRQQVKVFTLWHNVDMIGQLQLLVRTTWCLPVRQRLLHEMMKGSLSWQLHLVTMYLRLLQSAVAQLKVCGLLCTNVYTYHTGFIPRWAVPLISFKQPKCLK